MSSPHVAHIQPHPASLNTSKSADSTHHNNSAYVHPASITVLEELHELTHEDLSSLANKPAVRNTVNNLADYFVEHRQQLILVGIAAASLLVFTLVRGNRQSEQVDKAYDLRVHARKY